MRLALVSMLFCASICTAAIGQIRIDGSSTVFPITEAVAEEFKAVSPNIRVTVGTSGTGGGFKRFSSGEIDINNASRTITPSEAQKAKENGVTFIELPVALDGITVVVNQSNTWVTDLTSAELKKIWGPESKVKTWKDIRPSWPNEVINLYGPGTDSGTFDFFTEAVNGKAQLSRADFTKSEDDNMLVTGVSGDKNALGYFGYAYYKENASKLKVVPIVSKGKPILPNETTIKNGTYKPLSRKVYIYVNKKSAMRDDVKAFVRFYLKEASKLVGDVGYVPLNDSDYKGALSQFEKAAL